MTREAFIKILEEKGYSYEIEGDKLVVTRGDKNVNVWLESLKTLPPGVEFNNLENVFLNSLKTLPPGVEFNNLGYVDLKSLKTLPPGVKFNNEGAVWLSSLKTIPPGVEFKNGGSVFLKSLVGGWFSGWDGNIDGIDSKRLFRLMIKQGVFI